MEHHTGDIRPTAIEVGALWGTYMLESLVHHVFSYFLIHVQDDDIREYVKFCHNASGNDLKKLKPIFLKEGIPVPQGITSEDINLEAPRLYTDVFYMTYIKNMAEFALSTYALAYSQSSRKDIKGLFRELIDILCDVDKKAVEIMLEKGILTRAPFIPIPKEVDFVKRRSFLAGLFGEKRALTFLEINHLFTKLTANALGKALLIGFMQVTKTKDIKKFFVTGKELSNKYIDRFAEILLKEDIAVPHSFEEEVTDSRISPFTEKLMLFHISLTASAGLGTTGMAMAASPRKDLGAMYAKMLIEIGIYAEDGAKLLIDNEWMEQPPTAFDRDQF